MEAALTSTLRSHNLISWREGEWADANPAPFDGMMRQHVARKQWHALQLAPSEQGWLDAHPVRPADAVSDEALIRRVVDVAGRSVCAAGGP